MHTVVFNNIYSNIFCRNLRLLNYNFIKNREVSLIKFRKMSSADDHFLNKFEANPCSSGESPHITRKSTLPSAIHVGEKEIARSKWLSLNELTYKDPSGRERKWEVVKRTTKQEGTVDAVVVMAIMKRLLKHDCVILVKQYRPPMQAYTLEFPSGLVDAGETPETAAYREFKEETGYTCKIKHCSPATCLDPGVENCTVMLATAHIDGDDPLNTNPQPQNDTGEFIEVLCIPINELLDAINHYSAEGLIVHATVYTYAVVLAQANKQSKAMLDCK